MIPTIRASSLDRVLSCPGSLTVNAIVKPRDGDDGDDRRKVLGNGLQQ